MNSSRFEVVTGPYGNTLEDILAASGSLASDRVLQVIQDVAQGLEALHTASLCHKCLHPRAVALRQGGRSSSRWILTGAAYQQSLVDLNKTKPFTSEVLPLPQVPASWQAPEVLRDPLSYNSARDIWDLGVLICSVLSEGQPYSWPDPASFILKGLLHVFFSWELV